MQRTIFTFFVQFVILYGQCNFINAKALLGYNISPSIDNEYPYVVCIIKYTESIQLSENRLCTGTLISQTHVLTAEHCFYNIQNTGFIVIVGPANLELGTPCYPMWWIFYNLWTAALGINDTFPQNDISIVKIDRMFVFMNPIILSYVRPFSLLDGFDIITVGCGRINNDSFPIIKQKATLTIMSVKDCENRISELYGSSLILTERFMCTAANPYILLGDGDSGSPVLYFNTIIGMSLSVCPILEEHFHPGRVNLHLNLDFYAHFIQDIIEHS